MNTKAGGRPLPKFGEWDVNNPTSSAGFTVIFDKARDDKKTKREKPQIVVDVPPPRPEPAANEYHHKYSRNPKRSWLGCFGRY